MGLDSQAVRKLQLETHQIERGGSPPYLPAAAGTGRRRAMRRVEAMMTAASSLLNVGESPAPCRTALIR